MFQSILNSGFCHGGFKINIKERVEIPVIANYSVMLTKI